MAHFQLPTAACGICRLLLIIDLSWVSASEFWYSPEIFSSKINDYSSLKYRARNASLPQIRVKAMLFRYLGRLSLNKFAIASILIFTCLWLMLTLGFSSSKEKVRLSGAWWPYVMKTKYVFRGLKREVSKFVSDHRLNWNPFSGVIWRDLKYQMSIKCQKRKCVHFVSASRNRQG